MSEPLLVIQGLTASYGPVQVLFGIDIEVRAGEIVSVIGPNGAGKSMVIKAVIGLVPPGQGRIAFQGQDITGLPAHTVPGYRLRASGPHRVRPHDRGG
jgi:branched-chain amino acid transport system ATP-binding protein